MESIIAIMEMMPPDDAPVQAVAPMNATMEAIMPVMALGGWSKQRQRLHGHSVPHRCLREATLP